MIGHPDGLCGLTIAEVAEQLHRSFQEGYAAGLAAPRGIKVPCPGSGRPPREGTKRQSSGHPGRGACDGCGVDYKLTWDGRVWKHRRKK